MTTEAIAKELNVKTSEVERAIKQLAYRKEYNKRPEVVEKRKAYMRQRNLRIKEALQLLDRASTDPVLAVELGLGTRVAL